MVFVLSFHHLHVFKKAVNVYPELVPKEFQVFNQTIKLTARSTLTQLVGEVYPSVTIEVEYSDRYVDLIAEGFDVAIRLGELEDNQLVAKKLTTHRRLICAAPSYLATHGTPRTPNDLANHACLAFSRLARHPEWRFRQGNHVTAVHVSGPLTADDAQSLVTAALAGVGIVMCSDWLAAHERSIGLVPILTDWSVEDEGNVHLVRPSARFTAGKTRSFVDWISDKLKQPPWKSPDELTAS